jgi:hypothetical protein
MSLTVQTAPAFREISLPEANLVSGGGVGDLSGSKIIAASIKGAASGGKNGAAGAAVGAVVGAVVEFVSELFA